MSFILLGVLNSQAAGGAAGAYDLLETQVLTSSASSVTFTGLGSYTDYKHLQIRMTARSTRASADLDMLCQINGDTGSSYAWHGLKGTGSTVNAEVGTSQTRIKLGKFAGSTAPSDVFGAFVLDLLDFSSTSKKSTTRTLAGTQTGGFREVSLYSGLFDNTAAVTSITFFGESNLLVSGSRFSIYGTKGA